MAKTDLPGCGSMLRATMFGGFKIKAGGKTICSPTAETPKHWQLMAYLITFRQKAASQEKLVKILWPGGNIQDPTLALKNLSRRIRSEFAALGFACAREIILCEHGCYRLNAPADISVDAEEFEELYKQASKPGTSTEKSLEQYIAAVNLYEGDFLPGLHFGGWASPVSSHYRSIYFKCVYAALEILLRRQNYAEMEATCQKALIIDTFEEDIHKYLILAMVRQGRQTQALAHYGYVAELFARELGVSPSPSMRDLYRSIIKALPDTGTAAAESAREPDGAVLYCEYETFKKLYLLEAKTAARTGQPVFVCLLTAEGLNGELFDAKIRSKVMDILCGAIEANLRKGDVFSRFSATQYVCMMPGLDYVGCMEIAQCIIALYDKASRSGGITVSANIQPLSPAEMAK